MSRLPSIANLMSPPDPAPLDDFSHIAHKPQATPQSRRLDPEPQLAPMTPKGQSTNSTSRVLPLSPVSPWMSRQYGEEKVTHKARLAETQGAGGVKDPVLYPDTDSVGSVNDQPLFPRESSITHTDDFIDKHMAMHMHQFDKKRIKCPTREEYRLALSCVTQVGSLYNRNPRAYLKRQLEETEDLYYQSKRLCARPGTKAAPVPIAPAPKPAKRAINRVATPAKAPIPRVKRTPKASPVAKLMGYPVKGRSETPDRLPGAKREDVDYNTLPDYCPPTSTLPKGNPKILKADWPSNNVLNLSNDPDRQMLHEAEINLAGTLRLSCATYLCSKRRIFEARLNALKIGKEFRKTDAQQACKIDVNKASKLWTAFDKVGWFGKGHFLHHLSL